MSLFPVPRRPPRSSKKRWTIRGGWFQGVGILRTFVTFLSRAYYDRPLNGVTLVEEKKSSFVFSAFMSKTLNFVITKI
jgi:hypothetical protein